MSDVSDTGKAVLYVVNAARGSAAYPPRRDDDLISEACESFPHADPARVRAALEQERVQAARLWDRDARP